MKSETVEKVIKGVCYGALLLGTVGKTVFDIKDKDKAYMKAAEKFMEKKLNENG